LLQNEDGAQNIDEINISQGIRLGFYKVMTENFEKVSKIRQ